MMDQASSARMKMVQQQLRARGIRDQRVLEAMAAIPRENFLHADQHASAYEDAALPVEEGQTISQPYIVAAMTEALQIFAGAQVLEIGTGTGYQTALLANLTRPGMVFSIERHARLSAHAAERLGALGIDNVTLTVGDGSSGWPGAEQLFDRIMITAAAPDVPAPLRAQLAEGGILIAPIGSQKFQTLTRFIKRQGQFSGQALMECRFVPLVGEHGFKL